MMWLALSVAGLFPGPAKLFSALVVMFGLGVSSGMPTTLETKPVNESIEVKLSLAPLSSPEAPSIMFEVVSTATHRFCIWHTPLEGIAADAFEVQLVGGKRARYLGRMVKRGEPRPEHYVTLEPGTPKSATFRLNEAYDIAEKGRYTIRFKGNESINGLPDSNVLEIEVK